jgi:hypothetical protein
MASLVTGNRGRGESFVHAAMNASFVPPGFVVNGGAETLKETASHKLPRPQ